MNKKSSFALIPLNQRLTLHETTKKESEKVKIKKEFNRKRKNFFIKDNNILLIINYIKNNNIFIFLFIYLNNVHKPSSSLSSIGAFSAAFNSAVI